MTRTSALLLLPVLLVAAGCAGGDDRVVVGDGSGDAADPKADGQPGGGDGGLFASVEAGGGFVPVGFDFRSVPSAVVYQDGASLAPGAIVMVFPGPAVRPLIEGHLDEERVRDLAAAAADAGLLGEADVGTPPIADAATTTITVVVDGERHVTSVYALHEATGSTGEPLPGEPLPGLTAAQHEARERIARFVDRLSRAVTEVGGEVYEPERYRVLPLPGDQPLEAGIEADVQEWPFPDIALVENECIAITGAEADELGVVLAAATEITGWRTADGTTHMLAVRPVLPHERDCPA